MQLNARDIVEITGFVESCRRVLLSYCTRKTLSIGSIISEIRDYRAFFIGGAVFGKLRSGLRGERVSTFGYCGINETVGL